MSKVSRSTKQTAEPIPRDWHRFEELEPRLLLSAITVTSILDDGGGAETTLREAIVLAANLPGDDVIDFHPDLFISGTATITLTQGELVIGSNVEVQGPDADRLTIDAARQSGVFTVNNGADVTLSGMTITRGNRGPGSVGGGVHNHDSTVQIVDSVITNNVGGVSNVMGGDTTILRSTISNNSAARAAGIYDFRGVNLAITDSTISDNEAMGFNGGGLFADHTLGSITITNSTISGNTSAESGGAVALNLNANASATITNSTIAYNSGWYRGGGIYVVPGSVAPVLHNTIVAENTSDYSPVVPDDVWGTFNSTGSYNLIGVIDDTTSSGLKGTGTQYGTPGNILEPELAALGDYGGPTQTHAVLADSLAIDGGDEATLPLGLDYDQRGEGFDRVKGDTVDIGAVEFLTADIVFVVDESGSMGEDVIDWLADMIDDLDAALAAQGIMSNNYGLVGFPSSGSAAPHTILVGGAAFGTASEFATATDSLVITNGGEEDGYWGIDTALDYTFRDGAVVAVVLVTDEDRDEVNGDLDFGGVLDGLSENNAILTAVVDGAMYADDGSTGQQTSYWYGSDVCRLTDKLGTWSVDPLDYNGEPAAADEVAISIVELATPYPPGQSPIEVMGYDYATKRDIYTSITLRDWASSDAYNAFVIFDYQSNTDFNFAGAVVDFGGTPGDDRWVIGHYDGVTWTYDATVVDLDGIQLNESYDLKVSLEAQGVTDTDVTLYVNGVEKVSDTLAENFLTTLGYKFFGVGTNDAEASFGYYLMTETYSYDPDVPFPSVSIQFGGARVLGVDSSRTGYVPEGSGDYTTASLSDYLWVDYIDGYFNYGTDYYETFGEVKEDYVRLAWETGGSAWDINSIRANPSLVPHLTEALTENLSQLVRERDPQAMVESLAGLTVGEQLVRGDMSANVTSTGNSDTGASPIGTPLGAQANNGVPTKTTTYEASSSVIDPRDDVIALAARLRYDQWDKRFDRILDDDDEELEFVLIQDSAW